MNTYPQVFLGCLIIICYLHQFGWGAPYENENPKPSVVQLAKILSIDQKNRSALTELLHNMKAKRNTPSLLMQLLQDARNLAFVEYIANYQRLQHLLYNYCFHVSNRIYMNMFVTITHLF